MQKKEKQVKEFEERLLEIRRVTKVTTGGRRLSFRATMVIGNLQGKIGIGTGKGSDVTIAIKKAVHDAYKNISEVNITKGGSILYPISIKKKASIIKLIPAAPGTGLKAGSSVRVILELAGYKNILSKIVGTNNKLNNSLATVEALLSLKLRKSHKDRMSINKTTEEILSEKNKKSKNNSGSKKHIKNSEKKLSKSDIDKKD